VVSLKALRFIGGGGGGGFFALEGGGGGARFPEVEEARSFCDQLAARDMTLPLL
jgi:hypothetical protein